MFHYDFTELFSPKTEMSSLLFNNTCKIYLLSYKSCCIEQNLRWYTATVQRLLSAIKGTPQSHRTLYSSPTVIRRCPAIKLIRPSTGFWARLSRKQISSWLKPSFSATNFHLSSPATKKKRNQNTEFLTMCQFMKWKVALHNCCRTTTYTLRGMSLNPSLLVVESRNKFSLILVDLIKYRQIE